MTSTHDVLRQRLLIHAGVIEVQPLTYILEQLRETEWSPYFEQLMRNRLIMGAFRHKRFEENRKAYNYANAEEAIIRINRYQTTGNTEHLVDAANMCLLEFEFGQHPQKHFMSIDDGEHAEMI